MEAATSPMHIVSLIPEAAEILEALGLGDDVVVVPAGAAARDAGHVAALVRAEQPSLIFTSETDAGGGVPRAHVRRIVASLRPRPSVYALEPRSLGEILSDVKTVGDAVGRPGAARALIDTLRARIDAVSLGSARALAAQGPTPVACLVSTDPPLAAGWWLAEMVGLAGGHDVLGGLGRAPRLVTWDEIRAARPWRVPILLACSRGKAMHWDWVGVTADDFTPGHGHCGSVYPGPRAVDLLERLAARILHGRAGAVGHLQ